jgi:glycerol-3-phosphate dehydrogenase
MKRDFEKLAQGEFDLLVCGGGIYGAWTAYDAALRGLRVAIVEQGDWASATSSASSKLIHGGLRYLESYDFKLVKKALAERQMFLDYAPHRVWPLRFGVPVYRDSRVGMLRMKAGLMLYDALAGWPAEVLAHRTYNHQEFSEHFPFLKSDELKGGYTYGDAQTDDARLVLELIDGAQQLGCICVSYCKLTSITETHQLATGANIQDQLSGAEVQIKARQIVNTTGQWISTTEQGRAWSRMSKGIHLVMPGNLTGEAMLLTAPQDGRVFFIIPWYGMTLLGTTDDDYRGDVDHVAITPADVSYLLTAANHYLNNAWSEADIVGRYAGVRVMQRGDAEHPSQLSRDWQLRTADNGVHYSVGGKITSARVDAAHIVDTVCKQLGVTRSCATGNRAFPWTPTADYATWYENIRQQAARYGVDEQSVVWLIRRHGQRAAEVLDGIAADASLAQRIVPALPLILADLLWCARMEMVGHLDDLLRRRLPLLILARLDGDTLRRIACQVAPILAWDEHRVAEEILRCLP